MATTDPLETNGAAANECQPAMRAVSPETLADDRATPRVPDHELIRPIGSGAYGEVWLARNAVGTLRAVKVVHRRNFSEAYPFEREFNGIQKYEPVSRGHDGLIDILQIGRNDDAGYFYYVMELADDANAERGTRIVKGIARPHPDPLPQEREQYSDSARSSEAFRPVAALAKILPLPGGEGWGEGGPKPRSTSVIFDPLTYIPQTLRSLLRSNSQLSTLNPQPTSGRLPPGECLRIALALSSALEYLHQHSLVHRDIKPSNIIFVVGASKLADIGLVADVDEARSFVGTVGFIPPEGPGKPQADVYGLGKVLYEMLTGKDRQEFPALPNEFLDRNAGSPATDTATERTGAAASERLLFTELNHVILRACESDPRQRYASATAMHQDLALLQRGQSVKRQRTTQRRMAVAKQCALAAAALALLLVGGRLLVTRFNVSRIQRFGPANAELTSIAIVPFLNEDKRVRPGYLNFSLGEGVCTALTNVAGLRVAPLASVQAFRGRTNDALDIGRQLGVQWVLRAVFRNDLATRSNQMLVAAKLMHLPDGITVWSSDYDRTVDDLHAIQRDVLDNVARTLGVSIPLPELERMNTNFLRRREAWQLALRGSQQRSLKTREGFTEATRLFHQALEIDRTFVYAHQMLSLAYLNASEVHLPPHQAMSEARSWALRARELDGTAAFAYVLLGSVKLGYDWDLDGAKKELLQALELDPYDSSAHANYAGLLRVLGRLAEAREEQELATRLDPNDLSYAVAFVNQTMAEKNYDAALETSQELQAKHPDYYPAYSCKGRAYEKQGHYDQAMAEYRRAQVLENGPEILALIAHLHALRGEREEALRLLGELETMGKSRYVSPVYKARIYLRLGDRLKALELLEQAREERCRSLTLLKLDDDWYPLRDEPRFQDLLKKVGLEK